MLKIISNERMKKHKERLLNVSLVNDGRLLKLSFDQLKNFTRRKVKQQTLSKRWEMIQFLQMIPYWVMI
ncbi:CLUMA_CG004599, isoform A [Clunio marinus]|uniref:CLUMA_CG004599, isoform A n=1 Tax=Clunio marinus TaxID=568069 RepID=A0A1J1HWK9_9DIPT|nr:CLUMA_CG004599, isoform A [Clunio marinus]